jgi:hypothetical protein
MPYFDVFGGWTVPALPESAAARKAAADLTRIVALLRARAGSGGRRTGASVVLLTSGGGGNRENGFSWRLGAGRLEIHGASGRGLCNGVYDFLAALGVRWPRPGAEELPAPPPASKPGAYPVPDAKASRPTDTDAAGRRRLMITAKTPPESREQAALWAARCRVDALALPLADRGKLPGAVKDYGMVLEAGGWELSRLVPGRYRFFHRGLSRMEGGRRGKRYNFCPTSPEAGALIRREAERYFRLRPDAAVFHLWPDKGHELAWCSCPDCRAFTPEEQNRIAVNTAADVLAEIAPESRISYYETPGETAGIRARPNMFALKRLPADAEDGLYLV